MYLTDYLFVDPIVNYEFLCQCSSIRKGQFNNLKKVRQYMKFCDT